jgi:hypothetical protein
MHALQTGVTYRCLACGRWCLDFSAGCAPLQIVLSILDCVTTSTVSPVCGLYSGPASDSGKRRTSDLRALLNMLQMSQKGV